LDLIGDIISNSKLEKKDLEAERSVILREQEEIDANMTEFLFDHLHSVAFQRSPLAMTILGPKKNIQTLQRDQILHFIKTNYSPDRMILTAVGGNIDHNKIVDLAKKHFSGLEKKEAPNS
ncbi:MAG: Mitochondrial-processing peptidase subunit beta, partial [Paramarteilia canceri]